MFTSLTNNIWPELDESGVERTGKLNGRRFCNEWAQERDRRRRTVPAKFLINFDAFVRAWAVSRCFRNAFFSSSLTNEADVKPGNG